MTNAPKQPAPTWSPGDVEAVAQFLHDEVDLPDKLVSHQWPLHDGDDGYRGEGGWVKLQPKDIVEHYREAARRLCARFTPVSASSRIPGTQAQEREPDPCEHPPGAQDGPASSALSSPDTPEVERELPAPTLQSREEVVAEVRQAAEQLWSGTDARNRYSKLFSTCADMISALSSPDTPEGTGLGWQRRAEIAEGQLQKLGEQLVKFEAEAIPDTPAGPKMLVDADWLRRKIETDPDLDTEVRPGPDTPAPGLGECTMGVGCAEATTCYAAAHGQPEYCLAPPLQSRAPGIGGGGDSSVGSRAEARTPSRGLDQADREPAGGEG